MALPRQRQYVEIQSSSNIKSYKYPESWLRYLIRHIDYINWKLKKNFFGNNYLNNLGFNSILRNKATWPYPIRISCKFVIVTNLNWRNMINNHPWHKLHFKQYSSDIYLESVTKIWADSGHTNCVFATLPMPCYNGYTFCLTTVELLQPCFDNLT